MSAVAKHLSLYRDRVRAAQVASRLLMTRRDLDRVVCQALEEVVFQRDSRVDVLDWVMKIEREGGAVVAS